MIYYNFDRNKNLIERFKNKILTLHIGLDFNVDPMCAKLNTDIADPNLVVERTDKELPI